MSLQTLTENEGRDVFDESIEEEAFRKWSTFCFYLFFCFQHLQFVLALIFFCKQSLCFFLVLISQFVSDVLPPLLHTFSLFLIFHRFVQINDVP